MGIYIIQNEYEFIFEKLNDNNISIAWRIEMKIPISMRYGIISH